MPYLCLAILTMGLAAALVVVGPRLALWYGWPFALFLTPTWFYFYAGLRVDGYLIGSLILAAGMVIEGRAGRRYRPLASDVLVVLLTLSLLVSTYVRGEFVKTSIPTYVITYFLPYFLGRRFFRSLDDVTPAMMMLTACCAFLALYATVECLSGVNPVISFTGIQFRMMGQGMERQGMRRAQVLMRHPIAFGMSMNLLLPWAIEAGRRAKIGEGPKWWRLMPWLMGLGVFSTVTRSAWVAGLIVVSTYFLFRLRHGRVLLLALIVGGLTVLYLARDPLIDFADSLGDQSKLMQININGESYLYTGGRHRLLLFPVYEEYLTHAGWFGYGSERVGVDLEERLASIFWSIDCHYILWTLQFGYSGLTLFCLLELTILGYLLRIAWPRAGPLASLAIGLFGAMLAIDLNMFTVFMSTDYSTLWLFTSGIAATMYDLTTRPDPVPAAVGIPPAWDAAAGPSAAFGRAARPGRPIGGTS